MVVKTKQEKVPLSFEEIKKLLGGVRGDSYEEFHNKDCEEKCKRGCKDGCTAGCKDCCK